MIRALGVNVDDDDRSSAWRCPTASWPPPGGLLTQYQGFADVQMGIGMVVWGLASIIIGEALVGVRDRGYLIIGAVMGSVLFRLIVALALRGGLNPNDLKLVTAVFVFVALVLPGLVQRLRRQRAGASVNAMLADLERAQDVQRRHAERGARASGRRPVHRRGLLRHRHRHERIGQVDAAHRRRRRIPRSTRARITLDGVDVTAWPEHRRAG